MKLRFTISLISLLFSISLFSQWNQTNGPEGGSVNTFERIDGVIWATTKGGLYKYFDDGGSWHLSEDFTPEGQVSTIKMIADEIFLIVEGSFNSDFLYRSTDNGNNWEVHNISSIVDNGGRIFKMADWLFIEGNNDLWRSGNNGEDWTNVSGDIPFQFSSFSRFIQDETRIIAADYFEMFISEDFGNTWEFLDSINTDGSIFLEDNLIMIPDNEAMLVSYDLGENWTEQPLPKENFSGVLQRGETGKLFAKSDRLYVSGNNGASWDTINTVNYGGVGNLLEIEDGEFIISNLKGIFFTSNQGADWHISEKGMNHASVYYTYTAPWGEVFAETDIGDFRSPNRGLSWFDWETPTPYSFRQILWVGDTAIMEANGEIFFSDDQFDTYQNITAPDINFFNIDYTSMKYHNEKLYFVQRFEESIWVSPDLGETWENFNISINDQHENYRELEIINDVFLVLDEDGELYRSTDFGETWSLVLEFWSPGVTRHNFFQIGGRVILPDNDNWFYSDDEGLTWVSFMPTGMPAEDSDDAPEPIQVLPIDNLVFATTISNGVFVSFDLGETWQSYNHGLTTLSLRNLSYFNENLYLGTANLGVWQRGTNFQGATGYVYNDENGNGIRDIGELPMQNIIVEAQPIRSFTTSTTNGSFLLYADALNDTIRAVSPTPYAIVQPPFYLVNNTTTDLDFGIQYIPGKEDLCINASVIEPIRPGFESSLILNISNIGTTELSPEVKLILPEGLNIFSTNPIYNSIDDNTITWNLDPLPTFSAQGIFINFEADTDLELGTNLNFEACVNPIDTDENPENNIYEFEETVVGSYDPNDKKVSPKNLTPEQLNAGERLIYTIRFQNTGTYYAENVRIVDTLTTNLDISTLQIHTASHQPMDWHLRDGRILEFVFENIMLPDSTNNEPESHGFVQFSIQPISELILGDEVDNTGHIYFDFNEAIVTNTAITSIKEVNNVSNTFYKEKLKILPNPNEGSFQLELQNAINSEAILEIYQLNGQQVYTAKIMIQNGQIPTQNVDLISGNYLVKITLKDGAYFSEKLVIVE